jgi:DNA polymerase III epsilon subunit family exonuclease
MASARETGPIGTVRPRADVRAPLAYAVFDCETTGTTPGVDEIVSLAVVRLDAETHEIGRYARLVRPSRPIPADATAVHGITDEDVAGAPLFAELAHELAATLDGAVFVAHNAPFDLAMLEHAFAAAGLEYRPAGVACTLEAFRLLDPLAENHRLESICERRGVPLADAHTALEDALAAAALLRVLLMYERVAPETVELDHTAFIRLRSRGDTRPATERQVRRVFGMARSAGFVYPDGAINRERIVAIVKTITGTTDVDSLTREQIQNVYDALEGRIDAASAGERHPRRPTKGSQRAAGGGQRFSRRPELTHMGHRGSGQV